MLRSPIAHSKKARKLDRFFARHLDCVYIDNGGALVIICFATTQSHLNNSYVLCLFSMGCVYDGETSWQFTHAR